MPYFAEIDNEGTVQQVISISDADAPGATPQESEAAGQIFIRDALGLDGAWRQTSPDGAFRARFAGIGYGYDASRDVFMPPRPFPSWHLGDDDDWQPPTPYPSDGQRYAWDEDTTSWVKVPLPE